MADESKKTGKDNYAKLIQTVRDPRTKADEVVKLLGNRNLPQEVFAEIYRNRKWRGEYQVKYALCRNPRTPLHIVVTFLKYLYRPDLIRIARDVNLPPQVRQRAEATIKLKLVNLTLGERMALAKQASSAVCKILLYDESPRVVREVLINSRLLEKHLLAFIHFKRINPDSLAEVAKNDNWFSRYNVKWALIQNPRLPAAIAYEVLDHLMVQHLREVQKNERLDSIIRKRAGKVLAQKILGLEKEELHQLALYGQGRELKVLAGSDDLEVINRLLHNPNLKARHLKILLDNPGADQLADALKHHPKWANHPLVEDFLSRRSS